MCDYIIVVSKTWTCLHCAQIWGKNISQAKFRTISAKNQIGKMNTQLFHSALGVATFEHPMKSLKKSRQWTENCYSIQYPTKQLRLFNQDQRLRLNCRRYCILLCSGGRELFSRLDITICVVRKSPSRLISSRPQLFFKHKNGTLFEYISRLQRGQMCNSDQYIEYVDSSVDNRIPPGFCDYL